MKRTKIHQKDPKPIPQNVHLNPQEVKVEGPHRSLT